MERLKEKKNERKRKELENCIRTLNVAAQPADSENQNI
jgi:hypothetical protein